jgi:hypothetical protein
MRPILICLALGGCASVVPHPAADPAQAGSPLLYRPLAETTPAIAETPPLDWRAVNDEMRDLGGHAGHTGEAGGAGHQH